MDNAPAEAEARRVEVGQFALTTVKVITFM